MYRDLAFLLSAYVSIRQSIRQHTSACIGTWPSYCPHTSTYVRAYVSMYRDLAFLLSLSLFFSRFYTCRMRVSIGTFVPVKEVKQSFFFSWFYTCCAPNSQTCQYWYFCTSKASKVKLLLLAVLHVARQTLRRVSIGTFVPVKQVK
jgi:hypothetical protein